MYKTLKTTVRRAEQTAYVVVMPTLWRAQHSLRPHIVPPHIEVHITLPLGSGHRADFSRAQRWPGTLTFGTIHRVVHCTKAFGSIARFTR